MTTIIIVVVVALVFFVALCVVTFMVWKREEEMRTDSLRSIEVNLQELGYRMSGDFSRVHSKRRLQYDDYDSVPYRESRVARNRSQDPFEWTREDGAFAGAAYAASETSREATAGNGADTHESQKELQAYEDVYANDRTPEGDVSGQEGLTVADLPAEQGAEAETALSVQDPANEAQHEGTEEGKTAVSVNENVSDKEGISQAIENIENPEELDDFEAFEEYAEQLDMEALRNSLADGSVDNDLSGYEQGNAVEQELDSEVHQEGAYESTEDDSTGADGYVVDYIPDELVTPREPIGHDTGRSGKKYTAEELDMLIRE